MPSGTRLPSTRSLAATLEVSRPLVVEAYAQLAAEGYLRLRQGARPVVCGFSSIVPTLSISVASAAPLVRFDLRPAIPDLNLFPRRDWLRALRGALAELTADDLGYSERHGMDRLRRVIAEYLARVRGVRANAEHIVITNGFAEARALFCHAIVEHGIDRIGVEDPSYSDWETVDAAGLGRIPIPVDAQGIDAACLERSNTRAVLLTPAHQFPLGAVLAADRRARIIRWLEACAGFALEDDYDAEFRYDHRPIGAMQGLAPGFVAYAGTVSKTLAPGLRLGWLVSPPTLLKTVQERQRNWNEGISRIDQTALAILIETGAYDRHLRRMRRIYRQRRDMMIALLERHAPTLTVEGVAAGLHLTVRLPEGFDEASVCSALRDLGIAVEGLGRYSMRSFGSPVLLLGYGRASENAIRVGIQALARIVTTARCSRGSRASTLLNSSLAPFCGN